MKSQDPQKSTTDPQPPKLIPPPDQVNESDKQNYPVARDEIRTAEDVSLVENFIGSIYGEAKRLDGSNMSPDNQFTKGLKMDAAAEIKNVRRSVSTSNMQPGAPGSQPFNQLNQPAQPVQMNQPPPPVQMNQQLPVASGDSLILKHEIDQIKDQVKDIKKLYDEFFKLKQVKGKWVIKTKEKNQTTTTIAKTWNIINKMLKNKTDHIIIQYTEDEST